MHSPLIFDIKRYAINDGPGIRITLFFKGCPLSCKWCHNPESLIAAVQKLYTASKCIGAKECIAVCPNEALTLTPDGIVTDYEACRLCGRCADACPARAIEMSGRNYEAKELMQIIERERIHMDHSGGGVTFSGGEPLMFPDFLIKMLKACGEKDLHRAVDTSGFAKTETLLEVAKHTDLFLFDLKSMNAEVHKKWTGISNSLILANLIALSKTGAEINIRIPLIHPVNNSEESLREMAGFIANLPGKIPMVNLLPYHNMAKGKHEKMGSFYNGSDLAEPPEENQKTAIEVFRNAGIKAEIGG